jgi:DNA-directed RNA polymerase
MTTVYAATRFGLTRTIQSAVAELDREGGPPHLGGADPFQAARYLSGILHGVIADTVAAASTAMDWLKEVARAANRAGVPIVWTAPDGLVVEQAYREQNGRKVETHWMGKKMTVTLREDGEKLDGRGQTSALAPNVIHSMDAAHLRAVARAAAAHGLHVTVIHDSFGSHAADMDRLGEILRHTFVDQYCPDVLLRFRNEVAAQLPPQVAADLPPLPPRGTYDINDVLAAEYMFS